MQAVKHALGNQAAPYRSNTLHFTAKRRRDVARPVWPFANAYFEQIKPNSPHSPTAVYGKDGQVDVSVNAIAFLGRGVAQVRFTRTERLPNAQDRVTRWIATITYTYQARSASRPSASSKGSRSMSESNHARALLLPQEVKEIGDEEALILAKGCKPIQAVKIRWYRDSALKDRVRPPPGVAPVPLVQPICSASDDSAAPTNLATLYQRPLSDSALDLSDINIPTGEISEAEAEALADQLYAAMMR